MAEDSTRIISNFQRRHLHSKGFELPSYNFFAFTCPTAPRQQVETFTRGALSVKFMTLVTHDSGYFASERSYLLSYDAGIVSSTTRARLTVASKNCSGHNTTAQQETLWKWILGVDARVVAAVVVMDTLVAPTSFCSNLSDAISASTSTTLEQRRWSPDQLRSLFLRKRNFWGSTGQQQEQEETWLSSQLFSRKIWQEIKLCEAWKNWLVTKLKEEAWKDPKLKLLGRHK